MTISLRDYPTFSASQVAVRAALLEIGRAVDASGLDKGLSELVKLRVSQMNGCLFCVAFHLDVARRHGVAPVKLDLLTVWREAAVYDATERAALDWAEALTAPHAPDAVDLSRARLAAEVGEETAVQLTLAIANVTAWNRIARGLGFPTL